MNSIMTLGARGPSLWKWALIVGLISLQVCCSQQLPGLN